MQFKKNKQFYANTDLMVGVYILLKSIFIYFFDVKHVSNTPCNGRTIIIESNNQPANKKVVVVILIM